MILTIASAVRAASPPLSASSIRARALGIDGENSVAERQAARDRQVHQGPGGFGGDDVEMHRIAANDAAKRNDPVIGTLLAFRRIERDRDRGRNLQRARHADAVESDPLRLQHAARAREQRIGDIVVESRLDDENARAGDIAVFCPFGSARLGHSSLRQRSPGMDRAQANPVAPRRKQRVDAVEHSESIDFCRNQPAHLRCRPRHSHGSRCAQPS